MKVSTSIRRLFRALINIRIRYLGILATILAITTVIGLRANNEQMAKLRTQLYAADKAGVGVQQALNNLDQYVTHNMNTNLYTGTGGVYPPIQLRYTYNRILARYQAEVTSQNKNLYSNAQNYCQTVDPADFSGNSRVPCIESYVTSHAAKLPNIPTSLYEFDFISPIWSPGVAGWSIVLLVLDILFILFQLGYSLYRKL